jgi:glycosyltransferase involved in cell wall biosynthesis
MALTPKITVVVPCFNHGEFLPDAIASVLNANRRDVELIVVDDGSTEERTLREIDVVRDSGIRVIRQGNKGLAAARNAGIEAARGDYVLPLDADNLLRPAYFEHGLRILDANARVGVVYGDAEYIGGRTGRWRVGPFEIDRLLESNYIDACGMFRRAVWEQNGGYDGTMPAQGAEDWDFWLGAYEHHWEFAYVPEVMFEYRVADGSMLDRLRPFGEQLNAFLSTKHGTLYREAWVGLRAERRSVVRTSRRLARLLLSSVGRRQQ